MIDKTDKSLIVKLVETFEQHHQEQRAKRAARLSSGDECFAPGWRWLLPTPGNVLFTLLVIAGLLWAQSAGAIQLGALDVASTGTIAYQGRLADSAGAPLTGTYNMIFRLYTTISGGAPLWEEQWTGSSSVQVSDGLFNVMLGSLTPIAQAVVTSNPNLFLGITVGTDSEMSPRVQLGSVPFAVQALSVPDGSISQAKLAPDVNLVPPNNSITSAKIADRAVTSTKLDLLGDKNVTVGFATVTANGSGQATIAAYLAVLKPAHYWMACVNSNDHWWNTDYDFDYNASIGQLSGLTPNCKVVIYYVDNPGTQGNPVASPPNW